MADTPQDQIIERIRSKTRKAGRALLVALDGRSGVGKSTLARQVAARLPDCCLIEGDDFYAGGSAAEWDARSPQDKARLCMDWQRLKDEALLPLLAGQTASWHPFNLRLAQAWQSRPGTLHQPASSSSMGSIRPGRNWPIWRI